MTIAAADARFWLFTRFLPRRAIAPRTSFYVLQLTAKSFPFAMIFESYL